MLEGGTDRKGYALDALEMVSDGKVRLVSTEGDERGDSFFRHMDRVDDIQ